MNQKQTQNKAGTTKTAPNKAAKQVTPSSGGRTVKDPATIHNRERQLNSTNERFWKGRGFEERPANWEAAGQDIVRKQSK